MNLRSVKGLADAIIRRLFPLLQTAGCERGPETGANDVIARRSERATVRSIRRTREPLARSGAIGLARS
jgi:hypothetical protein